MRVFIKQKSRKAFQQLRCNLLCHTAIKLHSSGTLNFSLGDIRLDESGFGFSECIGDASVSYQVHVYEVDITGGYGHY